MRYCLCLCLIVALTSASFVNAQERCSPDDIKARVAGLHEAYSSEAAAEDTAAELESLQDLVTNVQAIHDECNALLNESSPPETTDDPGSGTLTDPLRYGVAGTIDNITLQIVETVRPADNLIRRANMFNERPEKDQVYIIVKLTFECGERRRENCTANFLNFKLVGDESRVYDMPFVVYDERIELELLAGGSGEGELPFLVSKTDTNLRLLYYPVSYVDEDYLALAAEPDPEDGIRITVGSTINIRSGPGTNFDNVGRLTAATMAIGRNEDGSWLRIAEGWVATRLVGAEGDIMRLKVVNE